MNSAKEWAKNSICDRCQKPNEMETNLILGGELAESLMLWGLPKKEFSVYCLCNECTEWLNQKTKIHRSHNPNDANFRM